MSTAQPTNPAKPNLTSEQSAAIRRGLWVVGMIVAAGISIAGFSIASDLLFV